MDGEGGAWMEGLKRSDIASMVEVAEFLMVEGEIAHVLPAALGVSIYPCAKNAGVAKASIFQETKS